VFTTLTGKPVGPDRLTRLFPTTGPYRRIRRWSRTPCSASDVPGWLGASYLTGS
jgi:hypothetical protein